MCRETLVCYRCRCKVITAHICYEHIAHTLQQKDNAPCPRLQGDQRRERSVPRPCRIPKDFVSADGTVFSHGAEMPRVQYIFGADPNGSLMSRSGRRRTKVTCDGNSFGSSNVPPQAGPQINQEEATDPKTNPELPPQPSPSWLDPSKFYNTEPRALDQPPAYTSTSSSLITPYDPDAELNSMFAWDELIDLGRGGKSMIKKDQGKDNEDQNMGDDNRRKRVKVKREPSLYMGSERLTSAFRALERQLAALTRSVRRVREERLRRGDADNVGGNKGVERQIENLERSLRRVREDGERTAHAFVTGGGRSDDVEMK